MQVFQPDMTTAQMVRRQSHGRKSGDGRTITFSFPFKRFMPVLAGRSHDCGNFEERGNLIDLGIRLRSNRTLPSGSGTGLRYVVHSNGKKGACTRRFVGGHRWISILSRNFHAWICDYLEMEDSGVWRGTLSIARGERRQGPIYCTSQSTPRAAGVAFRLGRLAAVLPRVW
ncbi:hypothetical protein BU24DRAFT_148999 [Aaosphaeria arxii CBS 175.79]|uniref:Uncharacterized protein n=1 Tax=Aaosphaeria arxii CBS 175.79 TaxID=1450172 RepID=A0A6A5XYK0_9PLEO|nr:uncharacterized protein BU24DRAFT_148999 [Aaosphaeria arxii CBS 175.79]KAF2017354.1 hypothetical protein BU24DRAFT_148999 [Aaosphaeria arxii CBS 175.79]